MEPFEMTAEQIVSEERLRVALFILRVGDRANREKDAIEVLKQATAYWPGNILASEKLAELRRTQGPRV